MGGGESDTILAIVNTLKEDSFFLKLVRGEKLVSKLGLHYSKEARCITLCHRPMHPTMPNRT